MVATTANRVLDQFWSVTDPRWPKLYQANRKISATVAPDVFADDLLHLEKLSQRLLPSQLHLIPDWSVVQKHKTTRINLAVFSNQIASKFKKQSGDLFDVVTVSDLSLAIVDFQNPDRLTKQIEAILTEALH